MAELCWREGINSNSTGILNNKRRRGRDTWKSYRELTRPKWSEAFLEAIRSATGEDRFTYVTAVTRLIGNRDIWEGHQPFKTALGGNRISIITLEEMVAEIQCGLTTTLAATEVGRILQLFSSAGMIAPKIV